MRGPDRPPDRNSHIIRTGVRLFAGSFSPIAFRFVAAEQLEGGLRVVTYDRA